jgi:hypothetical protein
VENGKHRNARTALAAASSITAAAGERQRELRPT